MRAFLSAVKLMLTLKCEQSTKIVSASLDGQSTRLERWAVRLHVIGCWSCRRFRRQVALIRQAVQSAPESTGNETLSADARTRIRDAIRKQI